MGPGNKAKVLWHNLDMENKHTHFRASGYKDNICKEEGAVGCEINFSFIFSETGKEPGEGS